MVAGAERHIQAADTTFTRGHLLRLYSAAHGAHREQVLSNKRLKPAELSPLIIQFTGH